MSNSEFNKSRTVRMAYGDGVTALGCFRLDVRNQKVGLEAVGIRILCNLIYPAGYPAGNLCLMGF